MVYITGLRTLVVASRGREGNCIPNLMVQETDRQIASVLAMVGLSMISNVDCHRAVLQILRTCGQALEGLETSIYREPDTIASQCDTTQRLL